MTGRNWEVINAGVNGYNTQQEDTYFRLEGVRYQPDIVVVTFVENDLDAVIDPNSTTWRRYPSWPHSLPEAITRLTSLSYTYQSVRMFVRAEQMAAQRSGETQGQSSKVVTDDPRWPAVKAHLEGIALLCAKQDIRFIVAAFSRVDPGFFSQLQESGIDTVSFVEAFARVPEDQRHVSRVDPHPAAAVHESMAELLVREIAHRGFLE
jgi:hypothetical protein